MNSELATREHYNLDVQRDPMQVLETASKAAKALQTVVAGKKNPVIINGEQYLEFEDWQTLGQFYGYTVRTVDAEPVEINGVQGAKARAELTDFRTGEIIGGAVAYCMADEERWAGRPWFQLASMAQTRSGAKAFRNRLAWIAVLAGYKATPAEEMTGDEKPREPEHLCPIHKTAFRKFTKEGRTWYSHKLADGSYCNEDKLPLENRPNPIPQPTTNAQPEIIDPPKAAPPTTATNDIPDWALKDVGSVMKWAAEQFHVQRKDMLAAHNVNDVSQIKDLRKFAEDIRGAYGAKTSEQKSVEDDSNALFGERQA